MLVEEHGIEYWHILDANKVFVLTVYLWFGQGGVVAAKPFKEWLVVLASLGEVGLQVACVGMRGICKDVGIPPVAISPGKVSPCDLLEDIGNVNGFQNGQVCNIFTILMVQVLKEWWEG